MYVFFYILRTPSDSDLFNKSRLNQREELHLQKNFIVLRTSPTIIVEIDQTRTKILVKPHKGIKKLLHLKIPPTLLCNRSPYNL